MEASVSDTNQRLLDMVSSQPVNLFHTYYSSTVDCLCSRRAWDAKTNADVRNFIEWL